MMNNQPGGDGRVPQTRFCHVRCPFPVCLYGQCKQKQNLFMATDGRAAPIRLCRVRCPFPVCPDDQQGDGQCKMEEFHTFKAIREQHKAL